MCALAAVFCRLVMGRLTAEMTFIKRPRRMAGIVGRRQNPPGRDGAKARRWECALASARKRRETCVEGTQ